MEKIKRVRRYAPPEYPNNTQVMQKPYILTIAPKSWRAKPAVMGALAATLAMGALGCTTPESVLPGEVGSSTPSPEPILATPIVQIPEGMSIPVFFHGDGRSSYGCISVAPPVVLSEEEARQVILEAALEYGVDFSGKKTLEDVQVPQTNPYTWGLPDSPGYREGSWTLDGYDENIGIGFEYISEDDVRELRVADEDIEYFSTVSTFDMADTAERFAQNVTDVAFFYDPFTFDGNNYDSYFEGFDWDHHNAEEYRQREQEFWQDSHAKSYELLRAQVIDFLEWLSAQGVI